MKMLKRAAFIAARRFIEGGARALEVARLHYAFDGSGAEAVRSVLAGYRNPDGGFGGALEPDVRGAESSALCSSTALQVLRSIGARGDEPMVASAIANLVRTLDRGRMQWCIIPHSILESPHAPHWEHASEEELFEFSGMNPTAEILGYLYEYGEGLDGDLRAAVGECVMGRLAEEKPLEMHELLCYLRLLDSRNLPAQMRERLRAKLAALIDAAVARDPARWAGYCLRPLQVVDSPDSPFIGGREELVSLNLDYEISTQNDDGSWTPTWDWGGAFPEEWERARREWTGIITLEKLLLLERFGRIEEAT